MYARLSLAVAVVLALSACEDKTRRYALEATPTASSVKVRARVGRVLVRSVSLPSYAGSEEIAYQDATGVIKLNETELWADDPERATTLVITRHLSQMTSALVAPQPWPLEEPPQAAVDIRIEQLVATNRGTFRLLGQYFIGGVEIEFDGEPEDEPKVPRRTIRSSSRLFEIEVQLASTASSALAAAQSDTLRLLAEKIARDLSR